jgi:hypothetical protein
MRIVKRSFNSSTSGVLKGERFGESRIA